MSTVTRVIASNVDILTHSAHCCSSFWYFVYGYAVTHHIWMIIDAVILIIDESYYKYKDHFYLQKMGVAMGNAISGFVADMVMEDLEVSTMKKLPFILTLYKRFVDDIITAIPETASDTILKAFNEYHPKLKFTIEEEINRSINFLDTTLKRDEDGKITTIWYRK